MLRHMTRLATSIRPMNVTLRKMSSSTYNFETLKVTGVSPHVLQVEVNRPEKLNAMNRAFWREMVTCFNQLNEDTECRAIVLTGSGRAFTAGLDVKDFMELFSGHTQEDTDTARKTFAMLPFVKQMQETFSVIEKCQKPVIAAVHGACIGGGIDMITACDIRYCTQDAFFQIKEVDLGLAADVGTLQRLPKIVGNDSLVRELAYTGRRFESSEAQQFGLVSRVFPDKEALHKGAFALAAVIATKSPVAVQGSKVNLVYSRDHSVQEGLDYIATWNAAMLQTEDMVRAAVAGMQKEEPEFTNMSKL